MEKVPKIVSERLRAAAVTVAHPDADLLTAFSEHTLPERERSHIVDHLARCSDCREVVALALPAEEAAVVEVRPARAGWLTWPRMRWAFVAAGVVVAVASVSLVQFKRSARTETLAKVYDVAPAVQVTNQATSQPEPVPAAAEGDKVEPQKKALAVAPASRLKARRDEDKELSPLESHSNLGAPAPGNKSVTGGAVLGNTFGGQQLAHGPKPPTQFQQNSNWSANANNGKADQLAPASPPVSNQQAANQLVVPSPAPGSNIGGPVNDQKPLDKVAVNGRLTAPLPSPSGSAGAEIARAKQAPTANAPQVAQATDAYAVSADGSNFSTSGSLTPESARWSINSLGVLQRSIDQGRSWQDVDVNAMSGKGSGMGLQMAMTTSRARVAAKENADTKQKPLIFRAVSANGPDVWAGGSEGNLYHSTDSGANWVRIVPSWRGIELNSDILNLQFSDPQHGRIVTSAAEIWTTADGGQTWEKH